MSNENLAAVMENLQEMKTVFRKANEDPTYQLPISWLAILTGSCITNLRAHGGIPI